MSGSRDTAKDIILNAEPSGKGPRPSRAALSTSMPVDISKQIYDNLREQMDELRRQQTDLMRSNEHSKKQLEANQQTIQRRLSSTENIVSQKNFDLLQRQFLTFERQIQTFAQDMSAIRSIIERQSNELANVKGELQNCQSVDNKTMTSTQILDQRLREIHNQMIQYKRLIDNEIAERTKSSRIQSDLITRLQDHVRQQEASKNDVISNITRRSEVDKERLTNETTRLNDKIQLITNEITKSISEREQNLRDEFMQKFSTLQANIKSQLDAHSTCEAEMNRRNEERWRNQSRLIEDLRETIQNEKGKYRDRFQKVSAALTAIEKHMELGNEKIDKIMNAEIQSRKLHEKGLLNKVDEVESQLNNYLNSLTRSVEDVKTGVSNIRIPILDTEALQRDMEAIAADKSKLSMEGLLKLEERITRMQHGLNRDRRELQLKIGSAIERDLNNKLRYQIQKLDDLMDEVESAQNRIRDKVERQVPKDLTELCAKVDNLKTQITNRIDQEEEERYLAIKELQEVYGRIASGVGNGGKEIAGIASTLPVTSTSLNRNIDECKVAIKKLAESVTTVKNVLDRKVQDEIRRREQDIEVLSSRLDALTIQGLQHQQQKQQTHFR